MPTRRSMQDRMLKRVVPHPVADFAPPPRVLCDGVWTLDRRFRHFGLALLPSRTTVVRIGDGRLVVVSPPPVVDAASKDAIAALGDVESVVVPNPFHYLYAAEFLGHFPSARLRVAPGVDERVPELGNAVPLAASPPDEWAGSLDYEILGPVRGLSEVMLFHVASGSLILTDLAFNMTRYPRPLDRIVWRLSGIPAGFGPGRTSRSLLLTDREVARRSLSRALEWPIERIVVAHGEVVEGDARSRLRDAFSRDL